MGIYEICFSPTGGTRRVLDKVSGAWEGGKAVIDLCDAEADFSGYAFREDDICLVAVPSFGGRVPACALSRIRKMRGGNARAVMVAVYGNRAFEDTLLELEEALEDSGFRCAAGIAAVAEHSIMHQFGAGRPDAQDEAELKGFSQRVKEALEQGREEGHVRVPGGVPYREYHGVPFKPKAGGRCTKCGLCAARYRGTTRPPSWRTGASPACDACPYAPGMRAD